MFFIYLLVLFIVYGLAKAAYFLYIATDLAKVRFSPQKEYGNKKYPPLKLYIGGDSVAAGVGAKSFENSTSGRFVNYLAKSNKVILNYEAFSGAKMADLLNVPFLQKQDITILIVSSNDLFRFTKLQNFRLQTKKVLKKFASNSKKLVIVGPGRVSTSPALPLAIRFIYRLREPAYAQILSEESKVYKNVVYIKPGKPTGNTFAKDKFHPNDAGHNVWFEAIKKAILKG